MGTGNWDMNIWELIKAGGPLMYPIILCSFLALGIIIEKLIYFKSIGANTGVLKNKVLEEIRANKIKEAIRICEDNNRSPVAKILKAGILKIGSSKEEIKESMMNAGLYEIPKLEHKLGALSTISHLSPLLGFLGTVTGMITCFHTIYIRAAALNPVTPADLAEGVFQALFSTVAGLLVAIPSYIAYNYFVSRVKNVTLEMEQSAGELIEGMSRINEGSI